MERLSVVSLFLVYFFNCVFLENTAFGMPGPELPSSSWWERLRDKVHSSNSTTASTASSEQEPPQLTRLETNLSETLVPSQIDSESINKADDDRAELIQFENLVSNYEKEYFEITAKVHQTESSLKELRMRERKIAGDIGRISDDIKYAEFKIELLQENTPYHQAIRDLAADLWLQVEYSKRPLSWVLLAVGNPFREIDFKIETELRGLVKQLIKSGFRIVYDADALTAETIRSAGENYTLGITSSPERQSERVILIQNPTIRLMAFRKAPQKIVSMNSLIGLALFIAYKTDERLSVWDPLDQWKTFLGFEPKRYLNSRSLISDLLKSPRKSRRTLSPAPNYGVSEAIDLTSKDQMFFQNTLEFARQWVDGLSKMKNRRIWTRGLTLFGPSRYHSVYRESISKLLNYFKHAGVPIILETSIYSLGLDSELFKPTRGSFFEVKATEDESTGVKRNHLAATFEEVRTALLLGQRQWILMGPGESAENNHFEEVLLEFSSRKSNPPHILFVDHDYYQSFFDWLSTLSLPPEFFYHAHLVDNSFEIPTRMRPENQN